MSDSSFDLSQEYEAIVQFLYIAPVGLVQADLRGEIAMINPLSAQLLMPLSPDGNLTNLFTALEPVVPALRHLVQDFGASHGMVCEAIRVPLGSFLNAKSQPSMLSLTVLKLDEERLMAVLTDITQQVAQERLLRQNEAWLNAIMMGVTDYALARLDSDGRVDEWNASIGRITGFSRDDTVGQSMAIFYPEGSTTPERVQDRLREADQSGWSLDEGWQRKADGGRFWGSAMIVPLRAPPIGPPEPDGFLAACPMPAHPARKSYSLVIRDITDKRDASETQRRVISCDHLTGIANRRTFFEAGELEFTRGARHARKLSLLMLDLDHFKTINDLHGHAAGDAVLKHFANLMTACFREVDVVARIGGEEFAVLMPSTDEVQALQGAERLRLSVESQRVDTGDAVVRYTVSAGIATVDSDAADLQSLMKRADDALYSAKAAGRNQTALWKP
ncbi:diguanylate cyclase [Xylophilus sp. Kf1]|nr:diguanylate cyclase [Xylophilus sp. Kf1]